MKIIGLLFGLLFLFLGAGIYFHVLNKCDKKHHPYLMLGDLAGSITTFGIFLMLVSSMLS